MAVAFDATSESHSDTAGSVSESSFSWTHTPSGTPAGVLVFVFTQAAVSFSSIISSVTYGGVSVPAVTGGEAYDSTGEPRRCAAYFLGSGISTGAQTVVVNRTNDTKVCYAVAITVTAAGSTSVYESGIVLLQEDQTLAEQSVNDGSPGTNSMRFAGLSSGAATVRTAGTNSTELQNFVIGAATWHFVAVRETTAGQGSRSVGWTSGTTDDVAAVHLAVYEVAASGLTITSVTPTDVYSQQVDVVVAGTKLSNSATVTFAGAACTGLSASGSTSLKITMPNFYTNNIKVGTVRELKIIG